MKVVISGGSGLVATELVFKLLEQTNNTIICLLSRNKGLLIDRYKDYADRVECYENNMLDEIETDNDTVVVHTAFARSSRGQEVAESLKYTLRLAQWAKSRAVSAFVNISSQSVYGDDYKPFITEDGVCQPNYLYALGKYASELVCEGIFDGDKTNLVNIRLSSICENARFLRIFVQNAIEGIPIKLTAPSQLVSFIDVRDVAEALSRVIVKAQTTSGTYNLGSGKTYTIKEIADSIARIAKEYGIDGVSLIIEDSGKKTQIGMNADYFSNTFMWAAQYSITDMIHSIFEMLTNIGGGGENSGIV